MYISKLSCSNPLGRGWWKITAALYLLIGVVTTGMLTLCISIKTKTVVNHGYSLLIAFFKGEQHRSSAVFELYGVMR